MEKFNDGRDWFFEKRYGMFVHWGIYSVNGFHEQEIYRKLVKREEYIKYADQFNPKNFNPDKWIDIAILSGMEYLVFTAKHIDGFCMWDTKYSDFNIMNTPYKKDLVKMLADACHKRNFPFGIYYSCADMNHKNYPNNNRPYEYPAPQPGDEPDLGKYMNYVKNQITELCSNYGELCSVFWDANMIRHQDYSVNSIIRKLQPNCVINNRGYDNGDYGTPEREFMKEKVDKLEKFDRPTEACQALGMLSWGYKKDESFYSSKFIMQSMDRAFCLGGNYLLNVGPKSDGTISDKDIELLGKIGKWLSPVKEAIYECESANDLIINEGVMMTQKDNNVFLHFIEDLRGDSVMVEPITVVPKRAVLLNTNTELICRRDMGVRPWNKEMEYLRIFGIPVEALNSVVPVIKLEYDELPQIDENIIALDTLG